MCRALSEGGRRCPCTNGDRRRAYQRMRYAARKAAQTDATDTTTPPEAQHTGEAAAPTALTARRQDTARAAAEALAAIRAAPNPNNPDLHAAYTAALIDHGAVLRDLATGHIDAELHRHGLDDAAITAEAAAFSQRFRQAEDDLTAERAGIAQRFPRTPGEPANPDRDHALADARQRYFRARADIAAEAKKRTAEINDRRAEIMRTAYYRELSQERSFGNAEFTPSNHAKMTRSDRAMFATTTALYPDEMVTRSAALGDMLAKRSKARAHYNTAAAQRTRRQQVEVLDLNYALNHGTFRRAGNYFVDSPEQMASGTGTFTDNFARPYTTVPRTPDNERRIAALLERHNADSKSPARMEFATALTADGQPEHVIYVRGPHTRARTDTSTVSAEVTYSDARSMTHELAHRMEDRNPEIGIATKEFLRRRTTGLPKQRYYKKEFVTEDSFADRYMGKDQYPGTEHTELFSCGMEALAHGRFGGLRGHVHLDLSTPDLRPIANRADPEHLALILGLLATANRPDTH
ncbi:MAG: hypothetical protein AB7G47_19700 [Mycolicibacterium sp.]|uniref:hypothetical protein n=1 Tax=Mycolicibacterium sp. TaxID=2320850 RepID=UPI003D14C979